MVSISERKGNHSSWPIFHLQGSLAILGGTSSSVDILAVLATLESLEVVQRRASSTLVEKDPALDEPGDGLGDLVPHERADWDIENPVELLESAAHSLGDPEEDHDERNDVEASIDTESTNGTSSFEQEGERSTQDGSPEETRSDGEAHAGLAMRQGVHLGTVGERNRAFTGGVEGSEHEDEQADKSSSSLALRGECRQTGSEQGPEHLGECKEKQASSAKSVDGEEGGEGEQPVDAAETEGAKHSLEVSEAGLGEDGGGVEGDDVDTAQLLGNHDSESSQVGTAHTGNREELREASDVVGLADDGVFNVDLGTSVEDITGNLDLVETELAHSFPGVVVAALLHVPARRLGAEVDTDEERHSGNERRTKHEAPVDVGASVEDGKVEGGAEEDTKRSPHFYKLLAQD